MRMSELAAKEIIDILTGERLGLVGESDLTLDEATGRIVELIVPARRGLWAGRPAAAIPWSAVRRVGPEVVIVELDDAPTPPRR
jgi:YlmC/YmxH family sporulation protein